MLVSRNARRECVKRGVFGRGALPRLRAVLSLEKCKAPSQVEPVREMLELWVFILELTFEASIGAVPERAREQVWQSSAVNQKRCPAHFASVAPGLDEDPELALVVGHEETEALSHHRFKQRHRLCRG